MWRCPSGKCKILRLFAGERSREPNCQEKTCISIRSNFLRTKVIKHLRCFCALLRSSSIWPHSGTWHAQAHPDYSEGTGEDRGNCRKRDALGTILELFLLEVRYVRLFEGLRDAIRTRSTPRFFLNPKRFSACRDRDAVDILPSLFRVSRGLFFGSSQLCPIWLGGIETY